MTHPTDPHAGLADLEPELDVDALVSEVEGGSEESDPIAQASKDLRAGSEDDDVPDIGDDEEADDAGDDEADDDADTEDDESDDLDIDDELEGDKEEEEGDEDEETEGDDEYFDLDIPAIAKTGGRSKVTLTLEKLPQEYHDLIRGHINRSQELDTVKTQLEAAQEYETIARFIDGQPLATMYMLEQQDSESSKPSGVAQEFVKSWLMRHPDDGVKLVEALGFDDPDALDDGRLKDKADAAQLRVEKAVTKGLEKQDQLTQLQRFVTDTGAVIRNVATELGLDDEETADFAQVAGLKVKRIYEDRAAKRLDPRVPKTQVLEIVQNAAKRFSGPTPKKRGKGSKKEGAAKRFERKAESAAKHRKTKSGLPTGAKVAPGLSKMKGKNRPRSVKEASRMLRGSK